MILDLGLKKITGLKFYFSICLYIYEQKFKDFSYVFIANKDL